MRIHKKSKILIIGSEDKFTLDYIYYKTFKYLNFETEIFSLEKSISPRLIAKMKILFSSINYFLQKKKILNFFKNKKKKYDLIIFLNQYFLTKKQ